MQNSLFHAQEFSNGDAVTDGDADSGSTLRKMPREAFKRKPRHHASPRHHKGDGGQSEAIVLKADLARRGVDLSIENGAILCSGDSVIIGRFARRIVEHKPALLELLTHAPDPHQLAREVTAARRGQWLTPTPALLAVWRGFEAHFGQTITSRQIGAIGTFVDAHAQLDNNELLDEIGAQLRRQGETI